jgi:uncharacterized membrane protein
MRKSTLLAIGIIAASLIVSAYFYPHIPDMMPAHWNFEGEVDSYMPKIMGLLLMPVISFAMLLLFIAIPGIDPLKKNLEKFRGYYDGFVVILMVFLFYLHLLVIYWNFNPVLNVVQFLSPAIGLLFYYMGILIKNARMNWFVGIKTPWTLSNEKVWNRTHKRGGKLFRISGLLAIVGALFSGYAFYFILVPVVLSAAYLVAYSYFEYQKETRKQARKRGRK